MKQFHNNKWVLTVLILIIMFSPIGNSLSAIAETAESSIEKASSSSEVPDKIQMSDKAQQSFENFTETSNEVQKSSDIEITNENLENVDDKLVKEIISEPQSTIANNTHGLSWEIGEGVDSVGLKKWVANNLRNYILGAIDGKKLGPNVGDKIEGEIVFPEEMKIEGFSASNWNNNKTITLGGNYGFYKFENINFSYPDTISIHLEGSNFDTTRKLVIERVVASTQSILTIGVDYSFSSKGRIEGGGIIPKEIYPGGDGDELSFNIAVSPSESIAFSDLSSEEQLVILNRMKSVLGVWTWGRNVFNGSRNQLPTTLPSLGWEIGDSYMLDIKKIFSNVSIDDGQNIGGHITVVNEPNVTYSDSAKGFMKHEYVNGQLKTERIKKGFINKSVVYWENVEVESTDLSFRTYEGSKLLVRLDTPLVLDKVVGYSGARGPKEMNVKVKDSVSISRNESFDERFIKENILEQATLDGEKIPTADLEIEYPSIETNQSGMQEVRITFKDNYSKFVSGSWAQLTDVKTVKVTVEDLKLTAESNKQEIVLGSKWEEVDPYDLVRNVKFGNQELGKEEYFVELTEKLGLDTVGSGKAKVLVTYKKDTTKTLSLDVPVNILWGNSVVYGGYDYDGSGRTTAAFTLNHGENPYIVASQGKDDDNKEIHSNFRNKKYYEFSWINMINNDNLTISDNELGDGYIQANGNDLKRDKLREWGVNQKQEVHYGDVVRAWQLETSKNWLYENEQRNSYNKGKQSVYYEITEKGYSALKINQANPKKRSISIDVTDKEIENKLNESIEIPDGVSAKFIEYPNRDKQGDASGIIRVTQILESGKTISYDYTVPFDVINDRLSVVMEKEKTVNLGQDISKFDYKNLIKEVRAGDDLLKKEEYEVDVLAGFDTLFVGEYPVKLRIRSDKSAKPIEAFGTVKVLFGYSIAFGGIEVEGVPNPRMTGAYTLQIEDSPKIVATLGTRQGNDNYIHRLFKDIYYKVDYFEINQNRKINDSEDGEVSISAKGTDMPKTPTDKWGEREVSYGDVIRSFSRERARHWIYNGDEKRNSNATKSDEFIYYEITKYGYSLLSINRLKTKDIKVPINSSNDYLDSIKVNFFESILPENIVVKFVEYPDTSQPTSEGKIEVSEILSSGKTISYDYTIKISTTFEVNEQYLDEDMNPIAESRKTTVDTGKEYLANPDKYLKYNEEFYKYLGWKEEETLELITGVPPKIMENKNIKYIYEKADKYINVTIPTEIVFGTYENTENILSNKYEIKNNSKELTTSVILGSFSKVNSSVLLLENGEEPHKEEDSARLDLVINDEIKIKGLNEISSNVSLAKIEPEDTINIGISGKYYDKTQNINKVEYNTILKFKAISGK